jgi:thiamine-phosphate pyrophosphorylase
MPVEHPATSAEDLARGRRERLADARLYLVCAPFAGLPAPSRARALEDLVSAAAAGGVDIVQLREKDIPDGQLLELALAAHAACERVGALSVVNDRPLIALESGADAVHVGQDDMPVAEVRAVVGPDMLIGLSTHSRAQIDAADAGLVDYIAVGPVYETPTKPGRPSVGLDLVRYAAAHAPVPFVAIGGIDVENIGDVVAAGARGVCVLRAITDAMSPEHAARMLRDQLDPRAES